VQLRRGEFTLEGYPALEDRGADVSWVYADSLAEAEAASRGGIRRLFALAHRKALKAQVQWFPQRQQLQLLAASLPAGGDLSGQLSDLIAGIALGDDYPVPRSAEQFEAVCAAARVRLAEAAQQAVAVVGPLLEAHHAVRVQLEDLRSRLPADSVGDIEAQIGQLTPSGFLTNTPWTWLQQYPRYFRGITARLEKLAAGGAARDARLMAELRPFVQRWNDFQRTYPQAVHRNPQVAQLRWMLEELRVSLFAQHLGTAIKISPQRLEKQWSSVV
jgi:ATP-dependent helicase HrpA